MADGVAFKSIKVGKIQAFKIDLKKVRLKVVQARDRGWDGNSVASLAEGSTALVAFNGGFFDQNFKPLGLLMSRGKTLNPLRKADWGVLTISSSGVAKLVHTKRWKARKRIDFALQSGPRLVVDGKPLKLKKQKARRTAIGLLSGGRTLVVVVAAEPLLTSVLAKVMANTFNCSFALNLDGGSSTQLWSKFKQVDAVSGFRVANAVVVLPR